MARVRRGAVIALSACLAWQRGAADVSLTSANGELQLDVPWALGAAVLQPGDPQLYKQVADQNTDRVNTAAQAAAELQHQAHGGSTLHQHGRGTVSTAEPGPSNAEEAFAPRHKDLFPFDASDWLGLILAIVGLVLAAGGGIGGGGILVPIYVMILGFSPKLAVALSNVTILGGAMANMALNCSKRHPKTDRPLVDWDLILIMEPPTIGGALIGSFLNKVLPERIMVFALVALLAATAWRTLSCGVAVYHKESLAHAKATAAERLPLTAESAPLDNYTPVKRVVPHIEHHGDAEQGCCDCWGAASKRGRAASAAAAAGNGTYGSSGGNDVLSVVVSSSSGAAVNGSSSSSTGSSSSPSQAAGAAAAAVPQAVALTQAPAATVVEYGGIAPAYEYAEPDDELKQILEEERRTPRGKVVLLTAFFLVTLALNLLKGGGGVRSPLGFTCSSPAFWALVAGTLGWVVLFSVVARHYLVSRQRTKAACGYQYCEGDVEWTPRHATVFPALCFFAGLFAGLFGVGGGIIKGPLMLEMGVLPQVASATSACMILYTSFTATTSFLAFGLLRRDYGILLLVVGLLATAVGQLLVSHLVKRYQRSSLIILMSGASTLVVIALLFIIGGVVAISTVLLATTSIEDLLGHGATSRASGGFCGREDQ